MCLLSIAWHAHPRYPLIVSANRDEYYARPSLPLDWWQDAPILAGRDLQAGGSWLGITRNGRFAALTNVREGVPTPGLRSRGELVSGFLLSSRMALDWAGEIAHQAIHYAGFNLLVCDGRSLVYLGNRDGKPRTIEPGVHALGNAVLGTSWPKIEHARTQLEQLLQRNEIAPAALLSLLSSRRTWAAHLLPETGVDPQQEALLSAPFIVSDVFGTRAATALVIDVEREVQMAEQSYDRGEPGVLRDFAFRLTS